MINTAIMTAVIERGPTVISMPGDVASADADFRIEDLTIPVTPVFRPADADLDKLAEMIEAAKTVAIFGGDGCRDARNKVLALADETESAGRLFVSRQAMAGER